MGAFRKKANAESLRRKIERIMNKKVEIIVEDNFYKVRISEIKTRAEVDKDIAILHQNGVNEVWVISLKAKRQQWVLTEKQDTVTTITESASDSNLVAVSPEMLIQLGAFNLKSNALKLRDLVSSKLGDKVIITEEGGYYKVRLAGIPIIDQTVLEVMEKLNGSLGKLGLKDMWVVPFKPQPFEEPAEEPVAEPVVIERVPAPATVEINMEVPAIVKPVTAVELKDEKIETKEMVPEPRFALQVGVYYKQSEALRAQRKIMSKLKLPVEIVKRYEYYHVIVTGFYTREETYKYYPELAGLGFPGVTVIERE
jgi:cell division protein FtsN